jgi:hypothetical protein
VHWEEDVSLWMLVAIVLVVAGILVALKTKQATKEEGIRFERKEYLYSPAERSFLGILEQALDSQYRIFGKVRLGDIVKPAKGLTPSKRATASNRINQKHVDFVICSATDLALLGVVELDDQSHGREDRVKRDEFVDRALAAAKIPVIHFSAQKGYNLLEVSTKLEECFAVGLVSATKTTVKGESEVEKTAAEDDKHATPIIEQADGTPVEPVLPIQESSAPTCPKCSSVMVKRQAMKGPHAGKFFWACSTFPKCKQVLAVGDAS